MLSMGGGLGEGQWDVSCGKLGLGGSCQPRRKPEPASRPGLLMRGPGLRDPQSLPGLLGGGVERLRLCPQEEGLGANTCKAPGHFAKLLSARAGLPAVPASAQLGHTA